MTKQDEWYWVRIGETWFPAMRDAGMAGGWYNGDTWEDWDHEVEEYYKIDLPKKTREDYGT